MGEVLGKSLGEAKGDLLEKKYNFYKAREVAVKMKEYIMELTSWVVVGTEMRSIIAACALLLGFKKESVYMKKKDGLWWEKLVTLLSRALFEYRYTEVKFRKAELDAKEKAATLEGEEGAP